MNLLLEIFNKLILNESVNTNSVTDAIKNRYRVTINYEGDPSHGVAPGIRTIEVYAYGLTKAGNPVIRAYQPYGDTVTKVPSWKFFRLDRVKSWKATYSLVTKPAIGFNPNGDKTMSVVYEIANFSNTTNTTNATGPKIVGKLDNIDDILADRNKEKSRSKQQQKTIDMPKFTPKSTTVKQGEPEVNIDNLPEPNKIQEPEISINNGGELNDSPTNDNVFKPKGELEQLEKVKDLNRRLDQARKIDLSAIPKR